MTHHTAAPEIEHHVLPHFAGELLADVNLFGFELRDVLVGLIPILGGNEDDAALGITCQCVVHQIEKHVGLKSPPVGRGQLVVVAAAPPHGSRCQSPPSFRFSSFTRAP